MHTARRIRLPPLARARYDAMSRLLHWLTLGLLVVQFLLGWLMPETDDVKVPSGVIAWHIGIGTSLLVMGVAWCGRAVTRQAPEPADQSSGVRAIASVVHIALYALLLLVPLLGWLNASGRAWPVKIAGTLRLPQIATPHSPGASIGEWHSASAWILLTLIGLHVFAVLIHQLVLKDHLLERML
ncbi:hypothetical protein BZM27_34785 [Paraburkholderia steynii]|uniref:Cytochrome b561 bacterial/Ni-hydrogenase domain-containing protein n=1 Tax=Paraburkholderia steynii TaxID=1245441 RepID=A0A4R0XGP3_9BURK|nr:hypothetical protein BZM27_34785 [Paraburkholderia steynii]